MLVSRSLRQSSPVAAVLHHSGPAVSSLSYFIEEPSEGEHEGEEVPIRLVVDSGLKEEVSALLQRLPQVINATTDSVSVVKLVCKDVESRGDTLPLLPDNLNGRIELQQLDETAALARGIHWLLLDPDSRLDKACFPFSCDQLTEQLVETFARNKIFKNMMESMKVGEKPVDLAEQDLHFLAIRLDECVLFIEGQHGSHEVILALESGLKSTLGLARLLVGVDTLEELSELAAKGDRRNVDTQVHEVLANGENSAYGQFPPETPIFFFGKAADYNKDLSQFRREDVACSLLHFMASSIWQSAGLVAKSTRCRNMFFFGPVAESLPFRSVIYTTATIFSLEKELNIRFLLPEVAVALGGFF